MSTLGRLLLDNWCARARGRAKCLALDCEVSPSTISNLRNGRVVPMRAIRQLIEIHTNGAIPRGAWDKELAPA